VAEREPPGCEGRRKYQVQTKHQWTDRAAFPVRLGTTVVRINPPWIKALTDVRRVGTMEGYGASMLVHQRPPRYPNVAPLIHDALSDTGRGPPQRRLLAFQAFSADGVQQFRYVSSQAYDGPVRSVRNGGPAKGIHPNIHWPDLLREMRVSILRRLSPLHMRKTLATRTVPRLMHRHKSRRRGALHARRKA